MSATNYDGDETSSVKCQMCPHVLLPIGNPSSSLRRSRISKPASGHERAAATDWSGEPAPAPPPLCKQPNPLAPASIRVIQRILFWQSPCTIHQSPCGPKQAWGSWRMSIVGLSLTFPWSRLVEKSPQPNLKPHMQASSHSTFLTLPKLPC